MAASAVDGQQLEYAKWRKERGVQAKNVEVAFFGDVDDTVMRYRGVKAMGRVGEGDVLCELPRESCLVLADDAELRWAEEDARRVQRLFGELGGFGAEDSELLLDASPQQLLEALDRAAGRIAEATGDARRLLLARLVLDHRLTAADPFRTGDGRRDDQIADLLLGARTVTWTQASEIAVAGL